MMTYASCLYVPLTTYCSRVQIELAMIDILEKQSTLQGAGVRGGGGGGEDNAQDMLDRLQTAEMASTHVVEGVHKLTETMSEILEKQRLLEELVLGGNFDDGEGSARALRGGVRENVGGEDGLAAEVEALKTEQQAWQKEIERAVTLTNVAFGDDSPFVPKQNLDEVRLECLHRIDEVRSELNEGAGFTPRNVPIEESLRRSQVFSSQVCCNMLLSIRLF